MFSLLPVALLASLTAVSALTAAEWRPLTIYQVITDRFARTDGSTTAPCNTTAKLYCDGTYQGLINHLDYIQGMGFDAIWISPPVKNTEATTVNGQAYHSYWQQDLYDVNMHFGTSDDLLAVSDALHARGMYFMVDVVANHFAWPGPPNTTDYSEFIPLNSKRYFHDYCTVSDADYMARNQQVELCWLGDDNLELVDVNTTEPIVRDYLYNWINTFVKTYKIDGLRVDTVKHVEHDFWTGFQNAAGVFATGEVLDGLIPYVCSYQGPLDSLLNYPLWFPLRAAFKESNGSMADLAGNVSAIKDTCPDSTVLGTFLENHDQPRFANLTTDTARAKSAIAFTLMADGVPIIYDGQEQHYHGGPDPENREAIWLSGYNTQSDFYEWIKLLNTIRHKAIKDDSNWVTYKAYPLYTDDHAIAIRKGFDGKQIIGVYSNEGEGQGQTTVNVQNTGYTDGEAVVDLVSCKEVTAGSGGTLAASLSAGIPALYYPKVQLGGSGICGNK